MIECRWLGLVRKRRVRKKEGERTFSILPPAKPTTIARPFHAIHFNEGTISPTGS